MTENQDLIDELFNNAAESFKEGNLEKSKKLREKAEELVRKIR